MHMAVTRAKYREDERVADYYQRMVDRVKSIPGVTAAGVVNRLPLSGTAQTGAVEFEGRSEATIAIGAPPHRDTSKPSAFL